MVNQRSWYNISEKGVSTLLLGLQVAGVALEIFQRGLFFCQRSSNTSSMVLVLLKIFQNNSLYF